MHLPKYTDVLTSVQYRILTKNRLISLVCAQQLKSTTQTDDDVVLSMT